MKIILLFVLLSSQFLFSQNDEDYEFPTCKLEYKLNTENLNQLKTFDLIVTNKSNEKIKVAKTFSGMRVQAKNTEVFDVDSKVFVKIANTQTEVCFLYYKGRFDILKPNESKIYIFNIKDLFLVNKVLKINNQYKFQLWFDMIDLLKWKKNTKYSAGVFIS
ncbi:hypothetical protein SAMN05421847_2558 [Halpernia humi]|uniref:Uncharacterized protein n=1 Tax=Halpernia humi TaxID=493375 RepID=A0A1H6AQ26_9FLAO|nr:hypothetical protein [Halpernia humi]SEG50849.1 hypothetical protein SAMN05421847_2558 [Halpernia humi]